MFNWLIKLLGGVTKTEANELAGLTAELIKWLHVESFSGDDFGTPAWEARRDQLLILIENFHG